jgi:di/tricarboxylate transporter
VILVVGASILGINIANLAVLCVYSLGLMGVISPYAAGPAPIYYGSGYIGNSEFWELRLIFALSYFVRLVAVLLLWLTICVD